MKHRFIARKYWKETKGLSLNTEALAKYNDIIDLSIGDTDFTTDRQIIDAAYRDACAGYTHYGDPKGDPELISAICQAWQEDFGEQIGKASVVITASSCLGMTLAMMATLDPGDEVIVFAPYFSLYKQQIELGGGVCVEVPTYAEEDYAIREDLLRKAITERTKGIIFNNPNNPTGMAYGKDVMQMLAKIAKEYDLIIYADEIYTTYMYEEEFSPMRLLPDMAERTITFNSFSKNFLMTGWRVGCVIADPRIIRTMSKVNNAITYSAPSISQRAAIEALKVRKQIRQEYITKYRERVFYAADRIEGIDFLNVVRPKGTFYLFPDAKKVGLNSEQICNELLEQAHVLVSAGSVFGAVGDGHFRIACTVDIEKMKIAFDRIQEMKF